MMKKQNSILSIVLVLILQSFIGINLEAQFVQNSSASLFSDVKAFREGDAITVLILEELVADNGASTQSNRNSELGLNANAQIGSQPYNAGAGLGTQNDFDADARTIRNERIRSKMSARVIGLEQNGNLIIEGKRTTKVNQEVQTFVVKGVVRPVDVLPSNSVYSYMIMDLTLEIEGQGVVSETQEPGLITKFLRLLF
ncbi:MAG: flagellar basal body L-ring protein FlgH [Candidatus Kapaibacteriales bacterium]